MPNASKKSATTAATGTTKDTTLTAEEVKRFTFLSSIVLVGKCVSALTVNKNMKDLIEGFTDSIAVITTLDLGTTLAKKRKEAEKK